MGSYTLDGVALNDAAGRFWLANTTGVRILPARRASGAVLPGRDGVVPTLNPTTEPGSVMLSLIVTGATHEEFHDNLEFIYGLVSQSGKLLQLVHTRGVANRVADIQVTASSEPEVINHKTARVTILASVPGVYWRAATSVDSSLPLTASSATGILTNHAGSTGALADALIRVKGAISSATLTDVPTGDSITLSGALTATEYVIIDPAKWTAKKVTTNTWTGGTDWSANVASSRGSGSMLILNPDFSTGAGRLRLTVVATNPATSPTVEIRARRSFL